jgi:hypothetical protein
MASRKKWLAVTVMEATCIAGSATPIGNATQRRRVCQKVQMIPPPSNMSQPKWRLGMAA